jgi:signal transduction histidine kinase
MTLADIQEKWMEPATSSKALERRSPGRNRMMMGSKGIGRFAAAKLGAKMFLRSTSVRTGLREAIIVGEIDWSVFSGDTYLSDVAIKYLTQPVDEPTGTEIEVQELSEAWSREKLERLLLELRRLISPLNVSAADDPFKIFLDLTACTVETAGFDGPALVQGMGIADSGDTNEELEPNEIRPFPLLTACDYEVNGTFDADGLFTGSMEIRRARQKPMAISLQFPLAPDEQECGPVGVRFFIFDREADALKSNMAQAGLGNLSAAEARSIIDNVTGVAVYRDGFRIRPYGDPENDWLTLDRRRVNDPSLRIGHNQIAGYLTVQSQGGGHLTERSSREGFEENGAYRRLQRLVSDLLAEVVEPRRKQFREKAGLSRKRTTTFDEVRQLAELKRLRAFVAKLPEADQAEATAVIDREAAALSDRIAALEDRHRLLEARSSLGAIMAEVLHEGEPPVGYVLKTSKRLLKLWHDIINGGQTAKDSSDEFPRKLAYLRESGERLSTLFTALRPLAGGRRNTPPEYFFITQPIGRARDLFASHGIPISIHGGAQDPKVIGYPDDLATAMINLIGNAVHWVEHSRTPEPRIDIRLTESLNHVQIDVEDNGPGIPAEFVESVFDVGFTLKDGGTGLGLNIAREALSRSGGVLALDPDFSPGARFVILFECNRRGA